MYNKTFQLRKKSLLFTFDSIILNLNSQMVDNEYIEIIFGFEFSNG